jgi:nicotinamidase-related amidase
MMGDVTPGHSTVKIADLDRRWPNDDSQAIAGKRSDGEPKREIGRNAMLIARDSLVLIVDAQAALVRVVEHAATCIERLQLLLAAADRLAVPVVVSEQYPQGLGTTDQRLLPHLERAKVLEKRAFSCWREPGLREALYAAGRRQIVVAGMEAHVCVLQTALDLRDAGYAVAMCADASSSRRMEDRALAIDRLRGHGVEIVTAEMVVFEWLERGEGPAFKALSGQIKALGGSGR